MEIGDLMAWRRGRLRELIEQRFGGNVNACGKAFGYHDGAAVRQMLGGTRPITEKSITKWSALPEVGGWFEPAAAGADTPPRRAIPDSDWVVFDDMKWLTDKEKQRLHEVAETRRQLAEKNVSSISDRSAGRAAAGKTALGRPILGQDSSQPYDEFLGGDSQIGGLDEIPTTSTKRAKGK